MTRMRKIGAGAALLALLIAALMLALWPRRAQKPETGARAIPDGGRGMAGGAGAGGAATGAGQAVPPSLAPVGAVRVVHEPALASGGFAGRVLNWSTGAGVPGAQVTFDGDAGAQTVTTDAEGRFRLDPPAPGRYVLAVASAPGFLPYAPEWGVSPIALVARPGLRIDDVTLFLRPAIDYTGVVEDPSGKPVAGATVRLLAASTGDQAQSPLADRFTSDARGEIVFHAPDDALLEARHPAWGPGRARLDAQAQVSHRLVIKLTARPDDTAGSAGLRGRVVDGRGAPVAGALVRAENAELNGLHPGGETRADAAGRFALAGLDPGLHVVRAVCDGCASATAQAMTGTEVTLVVGTGGALAGRVVDADSGEPVPAFTIIVSRPDGVVEKVVDVATVLDAEGHFSIAGLEPGDYRVRASADGHAASPPAAGRVTAPGDEPPPELLLRLTRGGVVFGRVVERGTGKPLGWARVSVEGGVGEATSALPLSVSAVTDARGEFTLTGVPPGMRSVIAAAYAHHMSIASGLRVEEGGRLGPLAFDLPPTREGEAPRLELYGIGARLRGEGDALMVDDVLAGGGAERAGLRAGDAIVMLDGEPVLAIGFGDAIQRIRGPEGSYVRLGVRRAGAMLDITAERRRITY